MRAPWPVIVGREHRPACRIPSIRVRFGARANAEATAENPEHELLASYGGASGNGRFPRQLASGQTPTSAKATGVWPPSGCREQYACGRLRAYDAVMIC